MKTSKRLNPLTLTVAALLAVPAVASATILAANSFEGNTLGAPCHP